MPETKLPPVREKLEQLRDAAVADGRIAPDSPGASAAITLPSFSKQTVALDDNGKPILDKNASGRAPGEFTDGATIPPVAEGTVATLATPAAPVAGTPAAPAAGAGAAVGATVTVAPAQAAAGAAAAEAAAAAVVEEYEEFEFEDPNFEGGAIKIPVRVPKRYAESAKRGYDKRTSYDRKMSYLANAEPVLRDLILDGRINQLLPLIQHALSNEEYGKHVTETFRRSQQGQPLIDAAVRELQAPPPAQTVAAPEFVDPFVDPRIQTLEQRLEAQERAQQEWRDQQAQAQMTQRQRHEQTQRNIAAMQGAHQDLAQAYPGVYRPDLGDKDPQWAAAYQYAQEAGYLQKYADLRAAIYLGGQGARWLESERLAAMQSPAAAAIAATESRLLDTATREAAAAARTVSGGAAGGSVPAAPPAKPSTKNPDGTLKDKAVYMNEAIAWRQQYGTG